MSMTATMAWVAACAVCLWIGTTLGWMIGHEEGVSDGLEEATRKEKKGEGK